MVEVEIEKQSEGSEQSWNKNKNIEDVENYENSYLGRVQATQSRNRSLIDESMKKDDDNDNNENNKSKVQNEEKDASICSLKQPSLR